ncbi:MAG TPA: zinc ribbon domain-containing protein, partial [Pyrinomonadaceae bacterium]|nr:zinc ribbon domain-containing protein [Pyrinomonadaceae bacterium]
MFCPQCGQQQASSDVRFCPRCGFQLAGVSGLLATGGATHADATQGLIVGDTPRRKGARLGGKLMLFGIFLGPVLAMMSEIIGSPEELALFGVIVFMAGLLRLIYAFIFEDGPFRRQKQTALYAPPVSQSMFTPPTSASALPPPQSVPARAYTPPRANTAEIVYQP